MGSIMVRKSLQYGAPGHAGPFPWTQVLPSYNEGQDYGVYEICEGEIERQQQLNAARVVAHPL